MVLNQSPGKHSPTIIKAVGFASGMLCFLAFVCLLFSSTSAYLLSGEIDWTDPRTGVRTKHVLGLGPFVAGSSTRTSEVVWWSELNDANCCNQSLEIYTKWSSRHHLCNASGHFVIPAIVITLQVVSSIATAFSFFACTVAFSSHQILAIRITSISAFVAMVFSCIHFAVWTTYPLAVSLQKEGGDVVPLWHADNPIQILPSPPVHMSFGVSYWLFVISFVLLFFASTLSFSVARLPSRFRDEYYDDDDDAGVYGMGKL